MKRFLSEPYFCAPSFRNLYARDRNIHCFPRRVQRSSSDNKLMKVYEVGKSYFNPSLHGRKFFRCISIVRRKEEKRPGVDQAVAVS